MADAVWLPTPSVGGAVGRGGEGGFKREGFKRGGASGSAQQQPGDFFWDAPDTPTRIPCVCDKGGAERWGEGMRGGGMEEKGRGGGAEEERCQRLGVKENKSLQSNRQSLTSSSALNTPLLSLSNTLIAAVTKVSST
jgi:hypothetical protein